MARVLLLGGLLACLTGSVYAHGFMSVPRSRGALRTQRNVPNKVMDPNAPIDYCPHCQNCGGVGAVANGGPWKSFKPFEYKREGITLCGDPTGSNDHMRSGRYANPPSTPYVANFKPGSVANFEFDVATNHNGFLEFYLCDVSNTGDVVNSVDFFKSNCRNLDRNPHSDCESGSDNSCGPIDPKFPGRWVLPCRSENQVLGGSNGKMAYKIPGNFQSNDAVVIAYYLTQNSCNDPDGFMDNYNYPAAWGQCPGDGGSVGGRPSHASCTESGRIPEEFFNCADVQVGGNGNAPMQLAAQQNSPNEPEPMTENAPSATQQDATPDSGSSGSDGQCSALYGQCGGKTWDGPKSCCNGSSTCKEQNEYYSQCLPM